MAGGWTFQFGKLPSNTVLFPKKCHAFFGAKPVTLAAWVLEGARRPGRRGEAFSRYDFATPETIVLSPLPCWRHLEPDEYRHRIADLVHEIEVEAERDRQQGGREPLGAEGVKTQNPLEAPLRSKKSPAPDFHAATKAALEALRADYREFVAEYREASAKYLAGDRLAQFPAGSFPPPMPYVE